MIFGWVLKWGTLPKITILLWMMMMMIMIMMMMIMTMMMMMTMIMTIVSVEQRPGWGDHVKTSAVCSHTILALKSYMSLTI
jgi:hypothetical protein